MPDADLVRRIVAVGSFDPPRAAKDATSTIPIVFIYAGDPVKDGFVTSLDFHGTEST